MPEKDNFLVGLPSYLNAILYCVHPNLEKTVLLKQALLLYTVKFEVVKLSKWA